MEWFSATPFFFDEFLRFYLFVLSPTIGMDANSYLNGFTTI